LFFSANDGIHGYELWKSDGTAAGTTLVKDIHPETGQGYPGSYPNNLAFVNGTVFLAADDGVHGSELWKSDGSAAGTQLVKDINTDTKSSYPQQLVNADGTLFFTADDGIHGRELWRSDGTEQGTQLVKDITPGPASTYFSGAPAAVGDVVFFDVRGATGG